MTNLHARTVMSRAHTQLNRPFRFNPSPQTQATGNQIFPARTWTFSAQPWDTVPRTAISPVLHPAVPVMPIPSLADWGSASAASLAKGHNRARVAPTATKAPSLVQRVFGWL